MWAGPAGALSGAAAAHLHGMLARCPRRRRSRCPHGSDAGRRRASRCDAAISTPPTPRSWKPAAADRAESEAERRFLALLRGGGFPGWVLGLATPAGEVDVTFPLVRVAVEVDGWAWHVDVDRFRADRRKQNALVLDGWAPLRFTWHDLVNRPDAVVALLRAALRRAA
ncbi:hypothetical protein [Pseudonocardia sp. NPDC049154]|uniref:endonuclease domain-containing protein n=1 Tax=Pseudonocardia sp. NPDC049154 TaxID=3155501 RepID=UPI0033DE1DCD